MIITVVIIFRIYLNVIGDKSDNTGGPKEMHAYGFVVRIYSVYGVYIYIYHI